MTYQTIAIIVNLFIILISLVGTFLLVKKLNFEDNNSRIIFLLYIVYWIPPLLCRDYTTSAHVNMGLTDSGSLMWLSVVVFGIMGIIWRPLNDIFTYKFKSRKLVIYLSLLIQLITVLSFLLYPCFATNIIQSIGAGVGASGIGLFMLMFNENQTHHKKFITISLFALPPIIAGFIVAAMESFVASFTSTKASGTETLNTIWFIWLLALVFIITSFILCFFVKEKRETLYQDNKYKEPIVKAPGHWKMVLLCVCAVCLTFVRWATAGPFAGMQLTYISTRFGRDSTIWEGYLGLTYSLGCLIGSIISASAIIKSRSNKYQPIIVASGVACTILYLCIAASFVNVPVFFWTNIINGIGFGLLWNIFMQIVLNKFYFKQNVVTPIGVFNMFLSVGISIGSLFIGLARYPFYYSMNSAKDNNWWNDFLRSNYISSMVLIGVSILLLLAFVGYYILEDKAKERMIRTERTIAMIGENEL